MSATAYARERMDDVLGEIEPLLEEHWREIAHYPDIPMIPAWEQYARADAEGRLAIYTARAPHLIGYAVYFVSAHPHYGGSLQAQQDILFVSPQYRRGSVAIRLIRCSEDDLRTHGVQAIYQHFKFKHDLSGLFARLEYEPVDQVWAKRLDR